MAAELKGRTAATKEARKALLRQIHKAHAPLKGKHVADSAIHGARKQIKMARATLRLLRTGLSKKGFRAQNERLRDAAKPLSEARDATVLLSTFDDLLDGQARGHGDSMQAIHDELTHERARTRSTIVGKGGLADSRRLLRRACTQASKWHVGRNGWSVIGAGLGKVYGQGRDAFAAARETATNTALHEWRKQVKYLRHQLRLLQPVQPDTLTRMVKELHELGNHLGDDHDLAVLQVKMATQPAQLANEPAQRRLGAKINRRRLSLQRRAMELGSRLYEETPQQFCSRLRGYWHGWRRRPS
jgi:CHAD domain-containing protein